MLLAFLFLAYYAVMDKNSGTGSPENYISPVFIRLEGEVGKPGIYSLQKKDDLPELLRKETGQSEDLSLLLNSEPRWDSGITIEVNKRGGKYFYEKHEIPACQKVTLGIPVNINRESAEGLTAVPGIGKSLALAIEDERIKRNGFSDISELKSLPGIGDKLLLKIKPYIRL